MRKKQGVTYEGYTHTNKERMVYMTYSEFYSIFEEYFTKGQISAIQKEAFLHYENDNGHKPIGKSQRQIAYSFMFDMLYNMEIQECIDYFKSLFRKPHYITAEFWNSLEYCWYNSL